MKLQQAISGTTQGPRLDAGALRLWHLIICDHLQRLLSQQPTQRIQ